MTVVARYNFAYKGISYTKGNQFEASEEDMKFLANDVDVVAEKKGKNKKEEVEDETVTPEEQSPAEEDNKSIKKIKTK